MIRRQTSIVVVLLVLGIQNPGNGQEKKPWWNPFASSSSGATANNGWASQSSSSTEKRSAFGLSSWSKSSPYSKSNGWWSRTVDALNPFDGKPAKSSKQPKPKSNKAWLFGGQTKSESSGSSMTMRDWFDGESLRWP